MKTCGCWLFNVLCLIASTSAAIIRSPDSQDNTDKDSSMTFGGAAGALIQRPTSNSDLVPERSQHQGRLYFTAYSCERSGLRLTCPPNMTVIPVHATYGRQNLRQCVEGQVDMHKWTNSCVASSRPTRRRIAQHCATMADPSQCIIPVFNEFFGQDPCPNTYKYLEVYYACG